MISNASALDAIVLAGGMGTRLREVVADRPKVLADVAGRPFLTRLLDQLIGTQVASVVLSTGYMAEMIEATIGTQYRGLPVRYSRENEPLGTGGALRLALDKTQSDPLLALNGDSFCDANIGELCAFHRKKKARATLLLTRVEDASRFGSVESEANGAVTRFEEKGRARAPGWINAGIYCLAREVISGIPAGRAVSMEHEIFPRLIGAGLCGFRVRGAFIDIGTPHSYAEAERFFG
ncbi:MAG TPA: nucleotidyltransferase family protein [Chthoniobacterales bacterium]|nr:nucleotidyltransferase family protein [Chthoniobacterales bacterium]